MRPGSNPPSSRTWVESSKRQRSRGTSVLGAFCSFRTVRVASRFVVASTTS